MANTYDPGDSVTCSSNFQNNTPVDADPATVKAMFRTPAGLWTTYTYGTDAQLVRDNAGDYHFIIYIPNSAAAVGKWVYRFEGLDGSGNPLAATENDFQVRPSQRY